MGGFGDTEGRYHDGDIDRSQAREVGRESVGRVREHVWDGQGG